MKVVLTWMLYSVLLCVYTHAESVTQDLVDDDDFKSLLSGGETNSSLTHQDVTNISTIVTNSSIFSNITHRGFIHGFGESISVILVSEIGDKTFFIAAILAMRNNKLTVFLAAVSALFLMTVLSGLLGWVVTTFIPREVTYYTCTAIMFLFGFKMLWEAWKMDENEAEEVQREVEQELARRGSIASVHSRRDVEAAANRHAQTSDNQTPSNRQTQDSRNDQTVEQTTRTEDANKTSANEVQGAQNQAFEDNETRNDAPSSTPAVIDISPMENEATAPDAAVGDNNDTAANDSSSTAVTRTKTNKNHVSFLGNVIDRSCKENSWFGKKCLKMFKLFINTFTMTFIAEWGDRSQLATIVLVGINDVAGVILGGCIGHFICTGGAVLAGALIAKYVSVRKVTFIGALVFLGFAIASIFISPQEDGIEGIPEINGYDNATRMINHNVSLTLALQHIKEEGGEAMFENALEYNDY
eukprot:TRINITY_DN20622_c0_g1_i12.p1 TRINITY_DN20622_c0_g1~~TRINITY_DN20622_c0_g1_i12.p1  ORF type:complete len:470 (-),score=94.93 TRINITY_DN20622_c0_g1_i12:91-1500(-)